MGLGSGGILTTAPAIIHQINGLSRDSAGSGAQPSVSRSPCPCLQVSGHSWEVQLPPLKLRRAKNPIFLFPGKLFQVQAPPPRCDIPREHGCAVQTLRAVSNAPPTPSAVPSLDPSHAEDELPHPWPGPMPSSQEASRQGKREASIPFRSLHDQAAAEQIFLESPFPDWTRLHLVLGIQIHQLAETRKEEG